MTYLLDGTPATTVQQTRNGVLRSVKTRWEVQAANFIIHGQHFCIALPYSTFLIIFTTTKKQSAVHRLVVVHFKLS